MEGYTDGPASKAEFRNITGIIFSERNGCLYAADGSNESVRKILNDGM